MVELTVGQRYDVVITADQPIANYYMRLVASQKCSNITNPDLTAILHYDGADNSVPTSEAYPVPNMICEDETGLVPIVQRNAGPFSFSSGMDIAIDETMLANEGIFSWHVNGSTFKIDWSDPTLLKTENHDPSYPADYNVVELNGTESTVPHFLTELICSGCIS
jgi:Multicopper oxidase